MRMFRINGVAEWSEVSEWTSGKQEGLNTASVRHEGMVDTWPTQVEFAVYGPSSFTKSSIVYESGIPLRPGP